MSHLLSRALCLTLLAASTSLWAAQPAIVAATPVVTYMPIVLDNPDFFEFTAEQKQQVNELVAKVSGQREPLDQSVVDLRNELRVELGKANDDKQLIAQLVNEIKINEAKRLDLSITCTEELRHILTDEQWETLIELTE